MPASPPVQEGDIIFQISRSAQGAAIRWATNALYSHMGVVLFQDGQPFVLEAATTVRYTSLAKWIARGKDGHFVLKRLIQYSSLLTPENISLLHSIAHTFEGKPYALKFEWSDRRIYCSELVWKLFQRSLGIELGQPQHLGDFKLNDPLVQQKLRKRFGHLLPLDEPIISPLVIFNSDLLQVISSE